MLTGKFNYPNLYPNEPLLTSNKVKYSRTLVRLAIYYSEINAWEKFVFLCEHYNFPDVLNFHSSFDNYDEYKELLSQVVHSVIQQFIVDNPTRDSLWYIINTIPRLRNQNNRYLIHYFTQGIWRSYAIDIWAAFAKLAYPKEELISFFANVFDPYTKEPRELSYYALWVDKEGNAQEVDMLCYRLLRQFFDPESRYKKVSTQRLATIYQYIVDNFYPTREEQQNFITDISHKLSSVCPSSPSWYDNHDSNPTVLIPLLEWINNYQPGLPNVSLDSLIVHTPLCEQFLDYARETTASFTSEKNITSLLYLLILNCTPIRPYIHYFNPHVNISRVAREILTKINSEPNESKQTDRTGLLSDEIIQSLPDFDNNRLDKNQFKQIQDNPIKPLSVFLSSSPLLNQYNYNCDLLYCLIHYPQLALQNGDLYTNICEKYESITFTGEYYHILELLTALGKLVSKTYNISTPLFIALMYSGKTPDGFYQKPENQVTDKTIMDVYLKLVDMITLEPTINQ